MEAPPRAPAGYLIVHNVSKKKNIGNLVRSAVAFGFQEVLVVGVMKYDLYGAHGSDKHIFIRLFHDLPAVRAYLRERGARVCGVEILPQSVDVSLHPFCGPTAFMLGNEGTGLSERQIAACDDFVYIPQYGHGTASLNVTVAGSIVMHHFALWARFTEAERSSSSLSKFAVEEIVVSHESIPEVALERQQRRQEAEEENGVDLGELFPVS